MNKNILLRIVVLATLSLSFIGAIAQTKLDKQVLMTIGDQPVTVKEFTDVYNKNNNRDDIIEKKSVDEYLDLFINFRMKVMEAYEMKLDTSAKFKKELEGYRKQLAKPYFANDEVSDELVEEAYQRKLKDIRASHILMRCDKHALPADTLKIYNQLMDIRKRAMKGEDIGTLAVQFSQDPSARDVPATETTPARKGNRGDLGWFTVFDMVYPFECGAYNTKEGEISMPIRTDYGYHLIKVNKITDAMGTIRAAHIFLKVDPNATEEEVKNLQNKADNIYNELVENNGKNWNEAVKKYTDDQGTKNREGSLSPFTVQRIVPEFIDALKELQPEEFSRPIRTNYGFHIVKLISASRVESFEKEKRALAERVEKDMRSKKTEEMALRQVKNEYGFKSFDKHLNSFMETIDSTIISGNYVPAEKVKMDASLFRIGESTFTVSDFVKYIKEKEKAQKYVTPATYAYQLYDAYQNETIMGYADAHLEEKYPEFEALVREYNDGILLFDLMEREVWKKAITDTVGLREYYERNATRYMWGDRVKACVITVSFSKDLPKVKEYLANGVPFDSLQNAIDRDSLNYVIVHNGFYQRGDNRYVDETEWKPGIMTEFSSTVDQATNIVNIIEVRPPECKTIREAKGLVTSDYQVELEDKWMNTLHAKYPVKINEKVLDKVRSLYQ